jgi:hypothetical protein
MEERAAIRLGQRPVLSGFLIEKDHDLRLHFPGDRKGCVTSGERVSNSRSLNGLRLGLQESRIPMSQEPFHCNATQRRVAPNEHALCGRGQNRMGTACNGKLDARWRFRRAARNEQKDNEKREDGQMAA